MLALATHQSPDVMLSRNEAEAGSADSGRLCKARRIVTTFAEPDGSKSKPLSERSADDPKGLFRVYGLPQTAVLNEVATDAVCASLPIERYASLSPSPEHERRLRHFLELTDAFDEGRQSSVNIACGDWTRAEEKPCDADEALAKIDWARMSSVRAIDWPHGVFATRITFSQSDGPLILAYLSGADTISAAKITYAWPAHSDTFSYGGFPKPYSKSRLSKPTTKQTLVTPDLIRGGAPFGAQY